MVIGDVVVVLNVGIKILAVNFSYSVSNLSTLEIVRLKLV
jgi:hypothetical protein